MQPSALIFDCDGTLADTMPPHYEAWVQILKPYGVTLEEDRFYAMGGWPTSKVAEQLISENKQLPSAAELTHVKEAAFQQMLDRVEAVPPVLEIARQYRGKLPMAVATGGLRVICEAILTHLGCLDWFDAVVTCEDVTRHKPNPDIFLEAARRLNVAPNLCRVYEDTDPGLESGRRAGMQCVDVRTMFRPRRVTPAA